MSYTISTNFFEHIFPIPILFEMYTLIDIYILKLTLIYLNLMIMVFMNSVQNHIVILIFQYVPVKKKVRVHKPVFYYLHLRWMLRKGSLPVEVQIQNSVLAFWYTRIWSKRTFMVGMLLNESWIYQQFEFFMLISFIHMVSLWLSIFSCVDLYSYTEEIASTSEEIEVKDEPLSQPSEYDQVSYAVQVSKTPILKTTITLWLNVAYCHRSIFTLAIAKVKLGQWP